MHLESGLELILLGIRLW